MIKPDKMDASYEAYQLRETLYDRNDEIVSLQAENTTLNHLIESGLAREAELRQMIDILSSTLDRERERSESNENRMLDALNALDAERLKSAELESTIDAVYERMEFYEWYWTANRSNHDRDEINTDYHQISGNDIPEEAWEE